MICNLHIHHSIIPICVLLSPKASITYVKNKSNVYYCLLDARYAFDKVNYGKLFNVLPSRDIHLCILDRSHLFHWGSYTMDYYDFCKRVVSFLLNLH